MLGGKMSEYDNTNKGALFPLKEPMEVIYEGNVNMSGFQRRVILIKRKNAQGQDTFEMFESVGNIKRVEEKESDKHPDGKGVLEVRKVDKTLGVSFWRRKSKNDLNYLSVSLSEMKKDKEVEKILETFEDGKVVNKGF